MGDDGPTTRTWDDTKWQRYGLLSGIVFVVLGLAALFVPGAPPARDGSAESIAKYFLDNDKIKVAAILFGFALIFGAWWLGSFWRVISRLESGGPRLAFIAAAGFIGALGVTSVGQAMFTVPEMRPGLAGSTEFAYEFAYVAFGLGAAFIAAHMLALAALTLRSGFLPKWMGWLALASSMICVVGTISAGTQSEFFASFQWVGYLTWLLWVLLASVLLSMRKEA